MITNYTPSAYMVHDQLHIRGGHQVSWLLDGVPVPNTNIASNVGPQFDPKDIDYLEVQRGGYSAEYGDRTYGVFNVVTRSGFERNRQAELVTSYGNFNSTNDQFSFGDHTDRFAYYGSISGYRTDLGLETSSPQVIHDQAAGLGGFASIIFNKDSSDQFRLVTSLRGDHYQVPNDPDQQAAGTRDVEDERDSFINFSWLHTMGPGTVLTVSPFYHFNRSHYIGGTGRRSRNPGRRSWIQLHRRRRFHRHQPRTQQSPHRIPDLWPARQPVLIINHRGWKQPHSQPAPAALGRRRSNLHRRSIQADVMADVKRRPAPDSLQRIDKRKFNRPAHRRRRPNPTPKLGPARILRALLSGSATANGGRTGTRAGRIRGLLILAAARRARRTA